MSERKLLAIMFTDVVGYSTSMSADEQAAIGILQKCRPILRGRIEKYHGSFLKEIGDGTLSSFPSAIEAVLCALEIQDELRGEENFRIRIGIHVGDVIREDHDVFGDGVNIAARIEPHAEPGGICVSSQVWDLVRNKPFLAAAPLGARTLKGIAQPLELYSITGDAAGAEFQQLRGQITAAAAATPGTSAVPARSVYRPGRVAAVAALVCVLGAAGSLVYRQWGGSPAGAARTPPKEKAIGVLPFANLSENPSQAYFGDGLTEDLTTALASVPGLRTAAVSSMFALKGTSPDIRKLGLELGISYVLEGSVRKSDEGVRFNAQLVETDTGRTLWAKKFDRRLAGIFQVQDEIVQSIVTELDVHLVSGEQARIWRASTKNPEAYDLFLKARSVEVNPEGYRLGVDLLDRALALDPGFTAALTLKGQYLLVGARVGFFKDASDATKQASIAFEKALEVDDRYADAHAGRAAILLLQGRVNEAEQEYETARSLAPAMEAAAASIGAFYVFKGDYPAALSLFRRAKELARTPNSQVYSWEIVALRSMGRLEEAYAASRRALELWPTSIDTAWQYANMCRVLKRQDELGPAIRRILEIQPNWTSERWVAATGKYTGQEAEKLVAELHAAGFP